MPGMPSWSHTCLLVPVSTHLVSVNYASCPLSRPAPTTTLPSNLS
jgi:hypothetical protein